MKHILTDDRALARAAAAFIIETGREALAARGRFDLLLSGGSTPEETYRALAADEVAGRDLWPWTHFRWSGERCVPPTSLESNYRRALLLLLDPIGAPPERVHRIRAELLPPTAAAAEYEEECPPEPDLVLLGMGTDGHIASLFPGSRALQERERRFLAVQGPDAPTARVTISPAGLAAARRVMVLVSGAAKSQALARAFSPDGSVERTPARLVRHAEWFVDRAAEG